MIKTHLQSKIFITIINIALYITISLLLIAITNIALVGSFDYPLGKRDHSLIIAIPLALFLFLNRKNKLNLFIAITLWMTFVYPTLMVKNLGIPDGRTIRDITVATTESNLFSIVTATVLTTLLSYASHASDRVVQIGTQILLRVIWCTALILPISFYFYWLFANSLITPNVLIAVFQTTPSEALEYLSFRGPKFTIGIVLILFIIIAVNILLTTIKSRSCQNISHNPIIHPIIIACGIFCLYMTSNNYIMQPLRDAITTIQEFNTFKAGIAKRQKNIEPLLQNLKNQGDSGLFVVVLGESQTKTHMSAYGYARMTTPWLNSKLNDKNFIIFNNAFSASISTVPALSQALTAINQYSSLNLAQAPSILEIAKSTGYETWWLSNQNQFGAWDTPITIMANQADHIKWINTSVGKVTRSSHFDGELIDLFNDIPEDRRKKLVFLHTLGCHTAYESRSPASFHQWESNNKIDQYDNAVLYQDFVMKTLFGKLNSRQDFKALIMISDHGEEPTIGHDADRFRWDMAKIPFWIAFSESYEKTRSSTIAALKENREKAFTNDMLFDFLCGILNITYSNPYYTPENDISAATYSRTIDNMTILGGSKHIKDAE